MKPDRKNQATKEAIQRITASLRTAFRLSPLSMRTCEKELGLSSGYLTRILAGEVELRISLVLNLCRLLGLPPAAFFAALLPNSLRRSPELPHLCSAEVTHSRIREGVSRQL